MLDGNAEIVAAFVSEASENLADIENDLLGIEAAGQAIDGDLVNKVFRAIHSIKGTAGYLGLKSISELAHEMENVLNLVRGEELVPTSAVVDALLRGADALKTMTNNIETSNEVDVSGYVQALHAAMKAEAEASAQETLDREVDIDLPTGELVFMMVQEIDLVTRQRQGHQIFVVDVDLMADVQELDRSPLDLLRSVYEAGELIDSYVSTAGVGDLEDEIPESVRLELLLASKQEADELSGNLQVPADRIHLIASAAQSDWSTGSPQEPVKSTVDRGTTEVTDANRPQTDASTAPIRQSSHTETEAAQAHQAAGETAPTAAPAASGVTTAARETSLRVNVKLLDTLMNLAGELVLGRNQLLQAVNHHDHNAMESVVGRIDQVTSELQDAIMQTRMQPIGTVFSKFPRIIRDLAKNLGKQCELTTEGKEVELDKSIIEAIGDPLTHLVRNAIDHGVETPDKRTAAGKSPVGNVVLRAAHQAGKINISITDDGAGINAAKLRDKAVSKGILSADQARELSDRDALRLIFHPGFSTAEKVTDVSGRGVGMDVVRTNIEGLGGTVDIDTKLDVGTTLSVRLPLTLAIIPSLVVRCGEERFAIPQASISELVRIKAGEVGKRIERVKDAEVLRLRGNLLPLVRPREVLGIDAAAQAEAAGDDSRDNVVTSTDSAVNIIVVETGSLKFGLIVDGLHDSEEIVVKPLGRHLKGVPCLAGATILGDGKVALILDVAAFASHCSLSVATDEQFDHSDAQKAAAAEESQTLLIFTNDPSEYFAVPMGLISRIERISIDQIDSVGGQQVLQYRGKSLPLICLENHLSAMPRPDVENLNVIVFHTGKSGRELGLLAPQLVDIRTLVLSLDDATFIEPGVIGSMIIESHVTRLIDLFALGQSRYPEYASPQPQFDSFDHTMVEDISAEATSPAGEPRVLLAEDSAFFRQQVRDILAGEGFDVTACEDGQHAWQTLQESTMPFDIVVTDIEMPNMNGYELTRQVRADARFSHLPVVAVTSLAGEEDIQRGQEAGVNCYQIKLDREELVSTVQELISGAAAMA